LKLFYLKDGAIDDGGEYVVVTADEIENCGSNLVISPENTIYLPELFGDNENEKALLGEDEVAIANEKSIREYHTNVFDENNGVEKNGTLSIEAADDGHSVKSKLSVKKKKAAAAILDNKQKTTTHPQTSAAQKSSTNIFSMLFKKLKMKSSPSSSNAASSEKAKQVPPSGVAAIATTTTTTTAPKQSQAVSIQSAKSNPNKTKVLINPAAQKVIRLDTNLYLINPNAVVAGAKGSTGAAGQKQQKNIIIAKCTCKQRFVYCF
jgi:hypothetical protein